MKKLLIIGGSDAGISAALRAREIDPDMNVTMSGLRHGHRAAHRGASPYHTGQRGP